MNYNRLILVGHLTRDPEQRSTPTGSSLSEFGLAVNSKFGKTESVLFIDCTAWEKTGALVSEYLHKGDPVLVEGRLDFRTWEDKEGGKRSKHSMTVERVQFMGGGDKGEKKPEPKPKAAEVEADDGEIPF